MNQPVASKVFQKRCSTCKIERPLSEFYRQADKADGHRSQCKSCVSSYSKNYHANKPADSDRKRASQRRYYVKHRTRLLAAAKQRETVSPYLGRALSRRKTLLKQYNLTPAEYDAMAINQGGVCAICQQRPNRQLTVDHDHETGQVRGLLCHRCNAGLGLLGDTLDATRRVTAYLQGEASRG